MFREVEVVLSAFEATHGRTVSFVSWLRVAGTQPESIVNGGDPTLQVIVTGLTYQPPAPSVPCSWGVITGGPAIAAGTATRSPTRTATAAVTRAGTASRVLPAGASGRAGRAARRRPQRTRAPRGRPVPGAPGRGSRM